MYLHLYAKGSTCCGLLHATNTVDGYEARVDQIRRPLWIEVQSYDMAQQAPRCALGRLWVLFIPLTVFVAHTHAEQRPSRDWTDSRNAIFFVNREPLLGPRNARCQSNSPETFQSLLSAVMPQWRILYHQVTPPKLLPDPPGFS